MKFEDLKLGQEVLVYNKLTEKAYYAIITSVGEHLPVSYYNEFLSKAPHHLVGFLYEGEIKQISTYRNEHEKYLFFENYKEFEKSINEIVEEDFNKKLQQIENGKKAEIEKALKEKQSFKESLQKVRRK